MIVTHALIFTTKPLIYIAYIHNIGKQITIDMFTAHTINQSKD